MILKTDRKPVVHTKDIYNRRNKNCIAADRQRGGEIMGYILPVEQYQYNDYQRRVIREKQNIYHIQSPFKVVLERQHQEISSSYDSKSRSAEKSSSTNRSSDELYNALTGKGRHFSELV